MKVNIKGYINATGELKTCLNMLQTKKLKISITHFVWLYLLATISYLKDIREMSEKKTKHRNKIIHNIQTNGGVTAINLQREI
jgi:hypothetical protein